MSKQENAYCLDFSGLGEGEHSFEYVVGEDFMTLFPEEDLFASPQVEVRLKMEKSERMMLLSFRFEGSAATLCDRCLRPLRFPIEAEDEVVVKTASSSQAGADDEENLWWITEKDSWLDLAPYFYETIVLHRPLQVFCPTDENGDSACDPAMLALYGDDAAAEERSSSTDPRWDALKQLKDGATD